MRTDLPLCITFSPFSYFRLLGSLGDKWNKDEDRELKLERGGRRGMCPQLSGVTYLLAGVRREQ